MSCAPLFCTPQSACHVCTACPNLILPTSHDTLSLFPRLGFATAQQIEKDHAKEPFDLFVLAGDISYATTDPPHNELEEVWDAYGRMTEPFMSLAPFQPNVSSRGVYQGTPPCF